MTGRGRAIALVLVVIFGQGVSKAQSVEEEITEENFLESVLTNSDDVPETFSPIDLNEATETDLFSIPGMTGQCASSIIAYRTRNRYIRKLEELSQIEGMTPEIMSGLKRLTFTTGRRVFEIDGESYFSVSPQRLALYDSAYGEYGILNFQRVLVSAREFDFSIVTDKDPGENSYLDFYSVAADVKDIWRFSRIIAGDYTISLGNGLLFSSGGMISKSAGAISPLFTSKAYSLRPYRSKGENKFLRGAAFALPFGPFELTAFGSIKNLAVHIDSANAVSSIDYSGLSVPSSERRNHLRERMVGGILRVDLSGLTGGVSATHLSYGKPFTNYYTQEAAALESFARINLEHFGAAAELLFDRDISFSGNVCLDYDEAKFAVGIRSLHSKIVQNYAGALSESYPANDEQGVYLGTTLRPLSFVKLGLYYDRFNIGSAGGGPDRSGEEIFVDSYISLSRKKIFDGSSTVLYLRYKYKTKEDTHVPFSDFPVALSVISGSKQNFRIDFKHRFNKSFSIRTRIEKNLISSGEKGEMVLFDPGWHFDVGTIEARFCFYRTDSYKSAFYAVEKDLPHVAEFTLLSGDGARVFLLGSINVTKSISAGLKMSRDVYSTRREITVGSYTKEVPALADISIELGYSLNTGG